MRTICTPRWRTWKQRQASIEAALAPKAAAPLARAIYLYDVTSVYFEGVENELADFGYNRDGKKGKKQLVAGLLTDGNGEPDFDSALSRQHRRSAHFFGRGAKAQGALWSAGSGFGGRPGHDQAPGQGGAGRGEVLLRYSVDRSANSSVAGQETFTTGTLRGPAGGGGAKRQALRAAV